MQTPFLERYYAGTSIVHHLDARVKIVVTVLYILSNALLPDGAWPAFFLAWGLLLAATRLAGTGYGIVLRRSFLALPFVLVAFTTLFVIPGAPLAAFTAGPWRLVVTDTGLLRFTSILVRSWLSVQMAVFLTTTTRLPDLLHGLQHLKLPAILVAIVAFMVRYLSVLTDEATRLMRARDARSAGSRERRHWAGLSSASWQARVAGNMAGQLFLRSYERSDRIYEAMLARGYRGHILTLAPHALQARDWWAGGVAAGILLLIQMIGHVGQT